MPYGRFDWLLECGTVPFFPTIFNPKRVYWDNRELQIRAIDSRIQDKKSSKNNSFIDMEVRKSSGSGAYCPFLPGIGIGNGVTLVPELSVIFAVPSFSTSSMRMIACIGT